MNQLRVNNIKKEKNRIEVEYVVEGELKRFFNIEEKFFIEYDKSIENVPDSICIIPFLSNILPIAWVTNATIYLKELDKNFYESLEDIKRGYSNMYPKINFLGNIVVDNVIENKSKEVEGVFCFFSGGADSFSTLIAHINEKPQLVTIWGSDIMLDDLEGWNTVKRQINNVCSQFNVNKNFVKCNFRKFINESELNFLVEKRSGDGWWHGFQHGIGLIGQAAPIAYAKNISKIYIASSYSEKNKSKTCASDPTIDNYFKFANCSVSHDQYNMGRLEKIESIIKYSKERNVMPLIRVCWESRGGENCCKCEKCYRTIYEIIACGADPNKYGFVYNRALNNKIKNYIMYKKILSPIEIPLWKEIKEAFIENKNTFEKKKEYKWIYRLDVEKGNNLLYKKIRRLLSRLKNGAKAMIKNYRFKIDMSQK